ncbi:MAG: SlyX family protein [Gammaproteobacteria bacterium]|nr:SlyX family protein [Gammaproteobacteria bacterium]
MNNEIVDLQMKLSFQEALLDDLNQVIIDQQQQISRLELAIETIKVQMRTMQTSIHQENGQQHEIPPHY